MNDRISVLQCPACEGELFRLETEAARFQCKVCNNQYLMWEGQWRLELDYAKEIAEQ